MSEAAELSVVIKGKEIGIKSLLSALERDLKKADSAAERTSRGLSGGLSVAQERAERSALQLAQAQARLAQASGDNAGAARILQQALQGVDRTSLAAINTQTQLARAEAAVVREQTKLTQSTSASQATVAAFKDGIIGIVGPAAVASAALAGIGAAAQSFKDAFDFKTELDATNASIAIQLRGVRDAGQTFAEGQAFATKYKLTQQELTAALQAGVGVMRASTSSTTDLLTTMQRLTVLAPDKPISEAARALRELQAGDTTSIKELFNVAANDANRMKAEIQGGADAVQVVASFLDTAGISMDALRVKTEGAAGAQRDLAVAQEELKLAQAEWASGPGLAMLEAQTKATLGLTRALGGGGGLRAAFAGLAQDWGLSTGQAAALFGVFVAGEGQAAALGSAIGQAAVATDQQAQATSQATGALDANTGALATNAGAMDADAGAALVAAANAKVLEQAKADLEAAAQSAAAGIIASGGSIEAEASRLAASSSLVDQLTAAYLRLAQATGEADRARRVAEGKQRLAGQQSAFKVGGKVTSTDNSGAIGFDAPGRQGGGDVLATIRQAQADMAKAETAGQTARTAATKGGGAARVKAEQDTSNKLLEAERDYQADVAQLTAEGLKKRQAAERSLQSAQLGSRAGFYAGLANIDDNALRQDLSARYEAAAQEAGRIAQTQGADAAQKYLEASRQQIEGESQIQQQIKAAQDAGDAGKAEYLKGVLALQQAANADELALIREQADAALAAEAARYTAAEAQYAEHLAKMTGIAAANGTTLGATLPGPQSPVGRPAPGAVGAAPTPATSGKPTPVVDLATPAAVDANGARTEGKLSELAGILESIKGEIGALRGDVRSLKQSRAAG